MDTLRFVNSKDIRKHLQDIGYAFSTLEAAWLIYQCKSATVAEKHTAWNELIETMPDCEVRRRCYHSEHYRITLDSLHDYLRDYMRVEDEAIRAFREDNVSKNGRQYVYGFKYYEREPRGSNPDYYRSDTLYDSFKAIYAPGMEPYDEVDNIVCEKYELGGTSRCCQKLYLTPDLDVMQIDPFSALSEEDSDVFYCLFDWLWFEFPTPFQKGDIVYNPRYNVSGRLCGGQFVLSDDGVLGWANEKRREMLREHGDTTDMCAGGFFQDEDGTLYPESSNSNYMDLEYFPKDKLTGAKRILLALSNYLKGEIDIGLFADAYHQILAEQYAEAMLPQGYWSGVFPLAGLKAEKEEKRDEAPAPAAPYVMTLLVQENRQVLSEGGTLEPIPKVKTHQAWTFGSFNEAKAGFRKKITELANELGEDVFADGAYQPLAGYCRRKALAPDHPAAKMAEAAARLLTDPDYYGDLPDWCCGSAEDTETLLCSDERIYCCDMDWFLDCNALQMWDSNAAYCFHFCEIEPIRGREIRLTLQKAEIPAAGGELPD